MLINWPNIDVYRPERRFAGATYRRSNTSKSFARGTLQINRSIKGEKNLVQTFEHQALFPASELYLMDRLMSEECVRPKQWLLGTGLPETVTRDPAAVVSLHQLNMVYRNIYRLSSYPDIGLRVGRALNLSRWGGLGMVLMSAASLREALRTAGRYRLLIHSRFDLPPSRHGDQIAINIHPREGMSFPVDERYAHEMLLGTLTSMIRDLLAEPFSFSRVQLHYPRPKHHKSYRQHLGCEVEFGAQSSRIWIPDKTMSKTLTLANPVSEGQIADLCDREFERLSQLQTGDITWLVKGELAKAEATLPSLEDVAAALQMSARTLRRRLQTAQTSFRDIFREHQLQTAMQALASPVHSIEEIALLCGFENDTGFREAFKRWTTMTPREFRKQLLEKK